MKETPEIIYLTPDGEDHDYIIWQNHQPADSENRTQYVRRDIADEWVATINQDLMIAALRGLKDIFGALDQALGDTDPDFPEDTTDDEIRQEEPVFWAAKEIQKILQSLGT